MDSFLGYVYAFQNKFSDAAKCFKRAGEEHLAMTMFTDLRMFDQAKVSFSEFSSGKINLNEVPIPLRNIYLAVIQIKQIYCSSKQSGQIVIVNRVWPLNYTLEPKTTRKLSN